MARRRPLPARTQADLAEFEDDHDAAAGTVLLEKLRNGRRATKPGDLPGDGPGSSLPFMWRKLTRTETQEATAAAVSRLAELGLPPEIRGYETLQDETYIQILWRAMRSRTPEVSASGEPYPAPLAPTADELRDLLHDDEADILASQYLDLEEETGATWATVTEMEREQIVAALKKKDVESLINFGSAMLSSFLLTLDDLPETSTTMRWLSSVSSCKTPSKTAQE